MGRGVREEGLGSQNLGKKSNFVGKDKTLFHNCETRGEKSNGLMRRGWKIGGESEKDIPVDGNKGTNRVATEGGEGQVRLLTRVKLGDHLKYSKKRRSKEVEERRGIP